MGNLFFRIIILYYRIKSHMYTTYGNLAGYLTYNTSLKFMVLIKILKRLLPKSIGWTTKILKIINFIAVFMNHPRTGLLK